MEKNENNLSYSSEISILNILKKYFKIVKNYLGLISAMLAIVSPILIVTCRWIYNNGLEGYFRAFGIYNVHVEGNLYDMVNALATGLVIAISIALICIWQLKKVEEGKLNAQFIVENLIICVLISLCAIEYCWVIAEGFVQMDMYALNVVFFCSITTGILLSLRDILKEGWGKTSKVKFVSIVLIIYGIWYIVTDCWFNDKNEIIKLLILSMMISLMMMSLPTIITMIYSICKKTNTKWLSYRGGIVAVILIVGMLFISSASRIGENIAQNKTKYSIVLTDNMQTEKMDIEKASVVIYEKENTFLVIRGWYDRQNKVITYIPGEYEEIEKLGKQITCVQINEMIKITEQYG